MSETFPIRGWRARVAALAVVAALGGALTAGLSNAGADSSPTPDAPAIEVEAAPAPSGDDHGGTVTRAPLPRIDERPAP